MAACVCVAAAVATAADVASSYTSTSTAAAAGPAAAAVATVASAASASASVCSVAGSMAGSGSLDGPTSAASASPPTAGLWFWQVVAGRGHFGSRPTMTHHCLGLGCTTAHSLRRMIVHCRDFSLFLLARMALCTAPVPMNWA